MMEYRIRTWASKRDRTANKRRTYYKLKASPLLEDCDDAPFDEDAINPIKPVKSRSFGKTTCTSMSTPDRTASTSVSTPFDEVSQDDASRPVGEITIQWDPSFDNQVSFLGEESVDHKKDYMMQINEGQAFLAIKTDDSYCSDSSLSAPADDLLIKMGEITFERQETLLEEQEEEEGESSSMPFDEDLADENKFECIIEEEPPSLSGSMDTPPLPKSSLSKRVRRLIKKKVKKQRKDMRKRLKRQRKKMTDLQKSGQSTSSLIRRRPWCSQSLRRGGGSGGGVANEDARNQELEVMFGQEHDDENIQDDKSAVIIPIIDDTPAETRDQQQSKKKKKKKIWNRISIKQRSNSLLGPYPIEHGKRLNSNDFSSQEDNFSSEEEDLSSNDDDGSSSSGRWSSYDIGGLNCTSELPTDIDEFMSSEIESPADLSLLRPQLANFEDAVCEMLEGGFEMIHSAVGSPSIDVCGATSAASLWKKDNDLDDWYNNRVPDENIAENKSNDNPMGDGVIFHTLPSEKKVEGVEESKSACEDDSVYQIPKKSVQSMGSHRGKRATKPPRPTRSVQDQNSKLSNTKGLSLWPWSSSPPKKKQDWCEDRVPTSDGDLEVVSAAERSSLHGTKFIEDEKKASPKGFWKTARKALSSLNSCSPSKALEAVPNTDTMSESESESYALNPLNCGSFRVMYEI